MITELKIDFVQAALGDTVELELPGGTMHELHIPEGTQPGDVITVRGKGVSHLHSQRQGDLKVIIQVSIPKKLSKRQRDILSSFHEEEDKPNKKGIFENLRTLWARRVQHMKWKEVSVLTHGICLEAVAGVFHQLVQVVW